MKSLLLALLALPGIAAARIGETPEECAKRYGKPDSMVSGEGWAKHDFGKGAVGIHCWFSDGKCYAIGFDLITESRVHLPEFADTPRFTAEQVKAILNANGSGWDKTGEDSVTLYYTTKDGKLSARSGTAGIMIEKIEERAKRAALLKPEAISKAIEGF